jgi:imidazolonepropionase-like amidohydrolase
MGDMVRTPEQLTTLRTTYVLKSMISRGFTTVRDTGGATKFIASSIDEGLIVGPRLFQCGKAISQTGGHGDFSPAISGGSSTGCCGGHSQSLGRTADGVPAVLKAVREELKQGADFIKVMVGGGVASETDAIETVQYSAEEIQAITKTAWQMGKKMCTAHAYTVEAVEHAVANGIKGIEHGNLIDEKTAKMWVVALGAERILLLSRPIQSHCCPCLVAVLIVAGHTDTTGWQPRAYTSHRLSHATVSWSASRSSNFCLIQARSRTSKSWSRA